MKVTPIKQYSQPAFPTRSILDEQPELLRLLPKRWQRNPVVLAALAGLCTLMLGHRATNAATEPHGVSRVAPLFIHGNGVGSYGCDSSNPPVFLSEADAREVIQEEGKRVGISFQPDSPTLPSVRLPVTCMGAYYRQDGKPVDTTPVVRSFTLDGTDKKRRISFEYISASDFSEWETREPVTVVYSATWEDIKKTAETVRNGLVEAKPNGLFAVFYDPVSGPEDASKRFNIERKWGKDFSAEAENNLKTKALDLSREQLRAQVRDFVKWLKAQGVI